MARKFDRRLDVEPINQCRQSADVTLARTCYPHEAQKGGKEMRSSFLFTKYIYCCQAIEKIHRVCAAAMSGPSHPRSPVSPDTGRHISFNETSKEKPVPSGRRTLTHVDFIRASEHEILQRYLSHFEQHLPSFVLENLEPADEPAGIGRVRLNSTRIHHKDDIELHHIRRIQIAFESLEHDTASCKDEGLNLIIDAFHVFIEHSLQGHGRHPSIIQCRTERSPHRSEVSRSFGLGLPCIPSIGRSPV